MSTTLKSNVTPNNAALAKNVDINGAIRNKTLIIKIEIPIPEPEVGIPAQQTIRNTADTTWNVCIIRYTNTVRSQ